MSSNASFVVNGPDPDPSDVASVQVIPWSGPNAPTAAAILKQFTAAGLHPFTWATHPGDSYAPRTHIFNKTIYVVRGSLTITLPDLGRTVTLQVGDRIDLSAGTRHQAVVGPDGVVCLEAHH